MDPLSAQRFPLPGRRQWEPGQSIAEGIVQDETGSEHCPPGVGDRRPSWRGGGQWELPFQPRIFQGYFSDCMSGHSVPRMAGRVSVPDANKSEEGGVQLCVPTCKRGNRMGAAQVFSTCSRRVDEVSADDPMHLSQAGSLNRVTPTAAGLVSRHSQGR